MRPVWKGTITFGMVTIPVAVYQATRREVLKFRLLRASDLSPVNYKRVAEADGKEVPWDQIVKGYEFEKGKFVVIKPEDFARVDVEATQTVDIINCVNQNEVNPLLFHKPYYMEPEKGGDKAYVLLRQALADSGKIAIAKLVIRTRQHLAAIKPQEAGLMLELMHFPEELLAVSEFKQPATRTISKPELNMAMKLVESMSAKWQPEMFKDDYHEMLEKIVREKIQTGGKPAPRPRAWREPSPALDLVSILQKSIKKAQSRSRPVSSNAMANGGKSQKQPSRTRMGKNRLAAYPHNGHRN